jgi:hypothetical protein
MASGVLRSAPSAFAPSEVFLAGAVAALIETALVVLVLWAGESRAHIKAREPEPPPPQPIKVTPVLDELPLLKLGGKKKPKLPEMWKKQPPVQRFQESSAPSQQASKSPNAIPTSALAKLDASAPPPDAETAKEVDQLLLDAGPDAAPTVEGEGAADGVKEGTETDPLKARAVSQYMAKILAWFNARFTPPAGEIPCDELKRLRSSVAVSVGGDRTVTSFSVRSPSGNAIFDARVQKVMQGVVGAELPPPPPLYPDILGTVVSPVFSGQAAKCEGKADPKPDDQPAPSPKPAEDPAPAPEPAPSPEAE